MARCGWSKVTRTSSAPDLLNHGRRGLVTVANLYCDPHRLAQILDGNQIHAPGAQRARIKMLVSADDYLLIGSADLDDVERRSRRHAESLALADGEIVNAAVLADHFAARRHQFAGGVGQEPRLLGEIGVDEALVIAAGDKTDLLRIGLLGDGKPVLARQFANLAAWSCRRAEKACG